MGNSRTAAAAARLSSAPMEAVGHAISARYAARVSLWFLGCCLTKENWPVSPKVAGAICRQVSQSMQVESTKNGPSTFSGSRAATLAMPLLSRPVGTNYGDSHLCPPGAKPAKPLPVIRRSEEHTSELQSRLHL